MFDNLKGIDKEREEKERDNKAEKAFETLLKTIRTINEQKLYITVGYQKNSNHDELMKQTKEFLQDTEFDAGDLRNLIFYAAGNDYAGIHPQIIGDYAGCLLELLTERNRAKGERTRFYINGKGSRFDYLFYSANNIDELIVENFKGERICNELCHHGQANLIAGINITGEKPLSFISDNGEVGIIIAKDIKGNDALMNTGLRGKNKLILLNNIEGNGACEMHGDKCDIDLLIGYNIKGSRGLFGAEDKQRIGLLLKKTENKIIEGGQDIYRYHLTKGLARNVPENLFNSGVFLPIDDEDRALYEDGKSLIEIGLDNIHRYEKLYHSDKKIDKQIRQKRRKRINTILALVKSMKNKNWEETVKTAYTIHHTYCSIKQLLEK